MDFQGKRSRRYYVGKQRPSAPANGLEDGRRKWASGDAALE